MTNFCPVHQHSFIASCADCDADDYIPFEGPLHRNRGPKKLSHADSDKIRELVLKLKLNEPGRIRRPGRGEGQ